MKKSEGRCNSILLQAGKNKYIFIGDGIHSFTTKNGDVIKKYYIDNNMSKWVKLEIKKYKSRDSPPYSAMDCKGEKLIGND